MSFLSGLETLLGMHGGQQAPHTQQPLNGQGLNLSGQGLQLQSGPGIQPQGQGSPAQGLQVRPQGSPGNLGVPYGGQPQLGNPGRFPQPGQFNPGFTPMQGPHGFAAQNPQATLDLQNQWQVNPQNPGNMQYWQ